MRTKGIPILVKIILLQLLFLVLHFLYDWFPTNFVSMNSGTDESVYQHMKIGFFAYITLVLVEYLIIRKNIISNNKFIFSRLFTASFYPLAMMVIYLLGPMVFGQFHSILAEIIFANVALFLTSLSAFIIERQVELSLPLLGFKIVVIALFFLSLYRSSSFLLLNYPGLISLQFPQAG